MKVVRGDGSYDNPMKAIMELGQRKKIEAEQRKERLLQKIIYDWNQVKSTVFWRQCFQAVPFDVIRATYSNIQGLKDSGYPVRNPAAFFVATLKKMGHYPWKKEDTKDGKSA